MLLLTPQATHSTNHNIIYPNTLTSNKYTTDPKTSHMPNTPTHQHPIHDNTEEPALKISQQAKIFNLLLGLCTSMGIIQRDASSSLQQILLNVLSVLLVTWHHCVTNTVVMHLQQKWKKNVLIRLESAITLNNF